METKGKREILGVLGGMGALASAEFLKTIYEHNASQHEQDAPVVMLYSDPAFPDRTEAFLSGEDHLVRGPLIQALNQLCALNASRIVMCCMTIHHLLPGLPAHLRRRVVSLPDTIFDRLEQDRQQQEQLMICSTGTRKLRLFEKHRRWEAVKNQIVFPDDDEQHTLHRLIYEMKKGECLTQTRSYIESLLAKYKVNSFIAGCSEIHLLTKQFPQSCSPDSGYGCVDPLLIIARELGAKNI